MRLPRAPTLLAFVVSGVGATLIALLLVSMFATELTRAFVLTPAEPPIALPSGVDIRYSDRLVALIGKGTPDRRAGAVTLGSVILVPKHFDSLTPEAKRKLIRHELVHVRQRSEYGRLYLAVYGVLYVIHGYTDHPFERAATEQASAIPPSVSGCSSRARASGSRCGVRRRQ